MKVGYQQANIAETLKIHPYRVKLAMQQAREFNEKQLAALYHELIENDYLVKSGQIDKEFLFQLFVLKHGKRQGRKPKQSFDCFGFNLLISQFFT